MIRVNEIVVVEGKYDKNTLSNILDASIIETNGFGIFRDKPLAEMIIKLSRKRGVIIITDSDYAGMKIRNYIINIVGKDYVKNVYIPDIYGKEKRKKEFSKEGKLGVEGMSKQILLEALERAGITSSDTHEKIYLTKTDFYISGLSGGFNSSEKRRKIKNLLNLPQSLSANKLIDVLNVMLTKDDYKKLIAQIT